MPNIYDYAQSFRRDLEAGATDTSLVMIKLYGDLWSTKIKPQIDAVNAEIDQDISEGKDPTLARQARRARVLRLQADMQAEMVRISAQIQHLIDQDIRAVVDRAQQEAQALMQAGVNPPPGLMLASFNRLPTAALENLTGAMQEGSPLKRLLDDTGNGAADEVGKALLEGLALGKGPREIARNARAALGGNMARALTIARTETLRAYREASRQTYAANPNIVKKWKWLCAKTARTCAVCWASNGDEFNIDQHMPTHPNCRCTMVPVTVSWADYAAANNIPAPPEGWPTSPDLDKLIGDGPSLFDKLSEEDQRRILGHSKYQHYKAGNFGLRDLIGSTRDLDWGKSRHEKSLKDLGLDKVPSGTQIEAKPVDTSALQSQAANEIAALQAKEAELEAEIFEAFSSVAEGRAWGNQQIKDANLTKAEEEALNVYTGASYKRWNMLLRGQLPPTATVNTEQMNVAIQAVHKGIVDQPIVVYRGSSLSALGENAQVGSTITDNGFMSTTINSRASFNGQAQFEIQVPTGSRGLYVESVSQRKNEREFLMPPGTSLEIVSMEVRNGITHVVARVVDQPLP